MLTFVLVDLSITNRGLHLARCYYRTSLPGDGLGGYDLRYRDF